jgi:hypothetical protein
MSLTFSVQDEIENSGLRILSAALTLLSEHGKGNCPHWQAIIFELPLEIWNQRQHHPSNDPSRRQDGPLRCDRDFAQQVGEGQRSVPESVVQEHPRDCASHQWMEAAARHQIP